MTAYAAIEMVAATVAVEAGAVTAAVSAEVVAVVVVPVGAVLKADVSFEVVAREPVLKAQHS